MAEKQKQIFLASEGDSWFLRNKKVLDSTPAEEDLLLREILDLIKSDPGPLEPVGNRLWQW